MINWDFIQLFRFNINSYKSRWFWMKIKQESNWLTNKLLRLAGISKAWVGVSFYRRFQMCLFVFSEKKQKAIQIWKYETSTYDNHLQFRGLRVEDGKIVIEEFKIGMAQCCAESVLRKTFVWNGKTFELKSLQTYPWNNEVKDFTGFPSENYWYS